jgi:hypothetical protein
MKTETQKDEELKNILFEQWKTLNDPFSKTEFIKGLGSSFATINYTFLQLSCVASKTGQEFLFDEKLSESLYDIRCIVDFFEQLEKTLNS